MRPCIKRIIDAMWRSESFQNYSSERSNDFINDSDRAERCYNAAENGCDGSTHAERIDDMRRYWAMMLRSRRRDYDRVDRVVSEYFDSLEAYFEAQGTLHEEVG